MNHECHSVSHIPSRPGRPGGPVGPVAPVAPIVIRTQQQCLRIQRRANYNADTNHIILIRDKLHKRSH